MLKVFLKNLKTLMKTLSSQNTKVWGAAGADLRASFQDKKGITLQPGEKALVPTGISLEIPQGYEAQVRPRSGLICKDNSNYS